MTQAKPTPENARAHGRAQDQLRNVRITRGYTVHAEGSVLIEFGDTRVLCTASVEEKVPGHKKGSGEGWVTAEYGMLPRATHTRGDREAARGKQSGRTQEIQRLIGRSMRAVFDLKSWASAPFIWIAMCFKPTAVRAQPASQVHLWQRKTLSIGSCTKAN